MYLGQIFCMILLEKKEHFSIYLFKGGFTKEFPMQRQNGKIILTVTTCIM